MLAAQGDGCLLPRVESCAVSYKLWGKSLPPLHSLPPWEADVSGVSPGTGMHSVYSDSKAAEEDATQPLSSMHTRQLRPGRKKRPLRLCHHLAVAEQELKPAPPDSVFSGLFPGTLGYI